MQGAVLDQMGRHAEAQRHYASSLKIVPDEPSVLSNLGLSYLLMKDLKNAEITLRRAVAQPNAGPKGARTWRWSSACLVASKKRKRSPVRICRKLKLPRTSITSGKCLRSNTT